ncbi:transposase, IS4 family protein [Shewanella baltica OS195]|uniref:Transposase, IS4 family protein n=1 Tax=Shewanella baltica (strain OS195) TaxID=399599 RepID=A9L073_SHEB9|nr:transposase, IS4 family protein [Shewanella baltica OS195]
MASVILSFFTFYSFLKVLFILYTLIITPPDYTSISKLAKIINVQNNNSSRGPIMHVVDTTSLKVFGEGEWKTRKYCSEKRCTMVQVALSY